MLVNQTVDEMEAALGEKLKRLRLNKNLVLISTQN